MGLRFSNHVSERSAIGRDAHLGRMVSVSSWILLLTIEAALLSHFLRVSPGSLEVELQVPCRGEAQMFVDRGSGFSQESSRKFPVESGVNRLSMSLEPGPTVALKLAPPACARQFAVLTLRASGRWRRTVWNGEQIRGRVTQLHDATSIESSKGTELAVVGPAPSLTLRAPGGITKQFARIFWLRLLSLMLLTAVGLELLYRCLSWDWRRTPLLQSPWGLAGALTGLFRQLPSLLALIGPKFLAVTLVTCWMGYRLVPDAWATYSTLTGEAVSFGRSIAGSSLEDRKRKTYGDCDNMGYGYVSRVLASYPGTDVRPIIRYPDFDRPLELVLPGWRTRVDPGVLIGIGLSEQDFQERLVADARRSSLQENGATLSRWVFQTGLDYELMTRVELAFASYPLPAARIVELTLIESPTRNNILGAWTITVPAGQSEPYSFALPSPVRNFSKTRGATDFILAAKELGPRSLQALRVYGVKVDGTGFVTVNRRESCFVAVKEEILAQASRNPRDPWAHFIETVRNVPLP